MTKFKTIQSRIDQRKDFKMKRNSVAVRNHRVVPDSIIEFEEEIVDTESGEVTREIKTAKCRLTNDHIEDSRGFIKHRRFRSLMGLSGVTLKLYCYMLEDMNSFGYVEMDYLKIDDYVGVSLHQQFTPCLRKLLDKSLIKRVENKKYRGWHKKWGMYRVEAATKMKEMARDKKYGRFVKIYNPAVISALSKGGLMLLCYIMDTCGYDGLVELKCDAFLKYTQDWLGKKGLHNPKCFYDARADLMSEKINILKPLYDIMENEDGKLDFESVKGWYRISPNVCFVGNRAEAGYEVGEEWD